VQKTARGKRERNKFSAMKSSKQMLRLAIEKGDLQRGQELLQIAKKRHSRMISTSSGKNGGSGDETTYKDLVKEVGMVESMVSQSRSQRQLHDMIKMPMSKVWSQRQLLQSLLAEARTGNVGSTKATQLVIESGAEMLLACEAMENCVVNLARQMSSEEDVNGGGLAKAIATAEELTLKHGDFCTVTLNNARSIVAGGGRRSSTSSNKRESCPGFVPLLSLKRQRLVGLQSKRDERGRLKTKALDSLEILAEKIRSGDDDDEGTLIDMLANVVQTVEIYAEF
jgi:hypothetical protein